jgi:Ca2+-binding EF-hand superfamily protein
MEHIFQVIDWDSPGYVPARNLFTYLTNTLKEVIDLEMATFLMPWVIPVSDGDEFLGWLIRDE